MFAVAFVTASDAMDFLGGYRLCRVPEIKSYILSWGHSVFGKKKYFFLAVCLSKRFTKVPEVLLALSFFLKTTKES